MSELSPTGVYLSDLIPALAELNEVEAEYAVVGGLAIGKWAESLLTPSQKERFALPILSKDLDIRGTRYEGRHLFMTFRETDFRPHSWVSARRKNAPEMGQVFAFEVEGKSKSFSVETIEWLPLLDGAEGSERQGSHLLVGGVYLLDPCSLMVCKIHAFNTRPEAKKSNDAAHIAILSDVIPAFLARRSTSCSRGISK